MFWPSELKQSEGECPLFVHPVMRLQTLIVVRLAIHVFCNLEGENCSSAAV